MAPEESLLFSAITDEVNDKNLSTKTYSTPLLVFFLEKWVCQINICWYHIMPLRKNVILVCTLRNFLDLKNENLQVRLSAFSHPTYTPIIIFFRRAVSYILST